MKTIYDNSLQEYRLSFDNDESLLLDSALEWDRHRRPFNYMESDDLVESLAVDAMEKLQQIIADPETKSKNVSTGDHALNTLTEILYTYSFTDEASDLEYRDLAIAMAGEILSSQVSVELSVDIPKSNKAGFEPIDREKYNPSEIESILSQIVVPPDASGI